MKAGRTILYILAGIIIVFHFSSSSALSALMEALAG